jgi:hypothetical protein
MEPKLQELINGRVKLQVYGDLCSLRVFTIDGKRVDEDDFCTASDEGRDHAGPYSCGNMIGRALPATNKKLKKYNLTVDEFNEIAEEVASLVSFESCDWCVFRQMRVKMAILRERTKL